MNTDTLPSASTEFSCACVIIVTFSFYTIVANAYVLKFLRMNERNKDKCLITSVKIECKNFILLKSG